MQTTLKRALLAIIGSAITSLALAGPSATSPKAIERLDGVQSREANAQETALARQLLLPVMAAYQRSTGDSPCSYMYDSLKTSGNVIAGAFTRKNAKQLLFALPYCGGATDQYIVGIVEKNTVVAAYTTEGSDVAFRRVRDLNGNGTDDVLVETSFSGAGMLGSLVTPVDFVGRGLRQYGKFDFESYTCQNIVPDSPSGLDAQYNDEVRVLYARRGKVPTFFEDVVQTHCKTRAKTMTAMRKALKSSREGLLKQIKVAAPRALLGETADLMTSALCTTLRCQKQGEFPLTLTQDSGRTECAGSACSPLIHSSTRTELAESPAQNGKLVNERR